MSKFKVNFFGLSGCVSKDVPPHIEIELLRAQTPEQIETVITKREEELASTLREEEFLICDSAADLMSQVLASKGIQHQVICGVNDCGDSHSYIQVAGVNYDPTHQGFGLELYTK